MNTPQKLALSAIAALLLSTTACSGTPSERAATGSGPSKSSTAPTELGAHGPGLSRVIFLGDSVAAGQAVPLSVAFDAANVEFHSMATIGGGSLVGPVSDSTWEKLPERIAMAKPSTVVYQVTTYDWGTVDEQRAGYQRLVDEAAKAEAKVFFVTMPPIVADEFYADHMDELQQTTSVAQQVADASNGAAVVLDASAVWGETYEQERDGKADRSSDGVHTCPQGAARFTAWLLDELARFYPTFTPPASQAWANTGWTDNEVFKGC